MYKEFYGLRANPFNVNPDPRYLFLTRHTEEALACLTYGIQSRKGFVLLTGEVGTGKTTLINKLLEWLRLQQVATAFIFNSRLNVPQFLDYMMADFGIPCDSKAKSQILLRLYNWLLDRYRAGETAVLIVDEAQNLSDEVLEEIRMLTNLETFTEKLLQIVLVGQPELEQKLKQPQLRQLRQRLTLRAKTHALTLDETKAYVQQRLRIAGSNGQQIFDPEALVAIHRYAAGIPRVINLICEHCLVSAFVDQQKADRADGGGCRGTGFRSGREPFVCGVDSTAAGSRVPTSSTWWKRCDRSLRWPTVCASRKRKRPPRRKETMSRIHEALKKAEQERAATQGGAVQPSFSDDPGGRVHRCIDAPASMMAARGNVRTRVLPAFASPFSLDTLLARCRADGMETGPGNHAVLERRRQRARHGGIPHSALAPVSPAREDDAEDPAGDQRAAEGRQVVYLGESGAGHGAAARTPGVADRCRSARTAAAPDAGHDFGSGALRLSAGKKR